MAAQDVLYIIDGHSLAYRAHLAFRRDPLTNSKGQVTSAIFGFARVLMDILEHDKPKYLAVAFDAGLSGRDEVYAEYKGTREKMPDDLESQIPFLMQLVEAFNIPVLMQDGYEADDVMGTIAAQAEQQNVHVELITGDGDILQLVTPYVRVRLRVRRKESGKFVVKDILYDETVFEDKYGFKPTQLPDFKALKGDSSDNIPGVGGIGDKSATKLIMQYGDIETLYQQIETVKGANKTKLVNDEGAARLSKQLATIQRDVPVQLDLALCVAQEFDRAQVEALYRELEFYSFLKQLDRIAPRDPQEDGQLPLFAMDDIGSGAAADGVPAPVNLDMTVVVVDSEDGLAALVETLNNAAAITFDVESTSTDQMSADLVGIALAADGETGYYVPVAHQHGEQLPLEQVMSALRPPLTNPDIPKYAHNADYDVTVMSRYGIEVAPITFDTMIAEWLHDPESNFLGLKNLSQHRLGVTMTDISELIGTGKKQITMDTVEIDRVAPYAAADAVCTHRLVAVLRPLLEEAALTDLFETLEIPLIPVIGAMERNGVLLDTDFLGEYSEKLQDELVRIEDEIFALSGLTERFNINSPKQLNEVLFDKLEISAEGVRKTAHGFSTAANVLETLRDEHPIIPKILEYREISKLKGTYVDALPELINAQTGRVHTSFNQTGTTTGRLSSSNPNLQNIPIRTEQGREVRRAFIAPEGSLLLGVDYSQVELRILAHISAEPTLLNAFADGQDIHAATAAAVNSIGLDEVTYEQRSFAKRVNFGLLYGMGPHRLARDSNLTFAEAEAFIRSYFDRLPNVERYIEDTKQRARKYGYLTTLLGRRRYFRDLKSSNQNVQRRAEREAINMPIQGTAADIIKVAMVNLHRELPARGLGAKMLLQVHDELVFEVPENEIEETARLVVDVMESAYTLNAPLRAEAEVGVNWREMEEIGG